MFRNFKVRSIAGRQPPESPFIKGDLRNSPLIKGARGLFEMDICSISKKVADKGSLIKSYRKFHFIFAGCTTYGIENPPLLRGIWGGVVPPFLRGT